MSWILKYGLLIEQMAFHEEPSMHNLRGEFIELSSDIVTSQKLMVVLRKSLDTPNTSCYAHDV